MKGQFHRSLYLKLCFALLVMEIAWSVPGAVITWTNTSGAP